MTVVVLLSRDRPEQSRGEGKGGVVQGKQLLVSETRGLAQDPPSTVIWAMAVWASVSLSAALKALQWVLLKNVA